MTFESSCTLLGVVSSSAVTEKEATKAYRKMAIAAHPDKFPGDPEALALFQGIQNAYEEVFEHLKWMGSKDYRTVGPSEADFLRTCWSKDQKKKENAKIFEQEEQRAQLEKERLAERLGLEPGRATPAPASFKHKPSSSKPKTPFTSKEPPPPSVPKASSSHWRNFQPKSRSQRDPDYQAPPPPGTKWSFDPKFDPREDPNNPWQEEPEPPPPVNEHREIIIPGDLDPWNVLIDKSLKVYPSPYDPESMQHYIHINILESSKFWNNPADVDNDDLWIRHVLSDFMITHAKEMMGRWGLLVKGVQDEPYKEFKVRIMPVAHGVLRTFLALRGVDPPESEDVKEEREKRGYWGGRWWPFSGTKPDYDPSIF